MTKKKIHLFVWKKCVFAKKPKNQSKNQSKKIRWGGAGRGGAGQGGAGRGGAGRGGAGRGGAARGGAGRARKDSILKYLPCINAGISIKKT